MAKISMNREILGLRCEIAGLVLVLIATVWQGAFTDWFDKNSREWIAYTQESVNLALLRAVRDLSAQIQEADASTRAKIADAIRKDASSATSEAISERERRSALDNSQAKVFSTIRYALLLLGAGLLVVGKWLVLLHKRNAAS